MADAEIDCQNDGARLATVENEEDLRAIIEYACK